MKSADLTLLITFMLVFDTWINKKKTFLDEDIELTEKGKSKSNKEKDDDEEKDAPTKQKKRQQSVLQAKLTKLAIQIGYAGNVIDIFISLCLKHLLLMN